MRTTFLPTRLDSRVFHPAGFVQMVGGAFLDVGGKHD